METITQSKKLKLIITHLLLAYLLSINTFISLSTLWGLSVVLIGTVFILTSPDPKGQYPLIFSAYIVGVEVLLRMTSAKLFWEFGKYSIIYFLLLGILRQRSKIFIYTPILFYFLLLIPSVFMVPFDEFSQWRQDVAFNLSGAGCLAISSLYMYNKTIDKSMLKNILFALALPIISMSIYNIIMMPDLSSYYFQPYSNPITSGRFGPNQVSTLFGLGIVSILIMQVFKTNLFGSVIIDYSILGLFCILGLLTFSRGGILAAIISFSVSFSYFIFRKQKKILILRNGIGLVFVALISWYLIVSITDGVISQRYGIGKTAYSEKLFIDFTGRLEIYSIDLSIFSDNFFTGVGPGQANTLREVYGYGKNVAAHIEYSRMLAEHGVFGLASLMLLLIIPIAIFNNISNPEKKTIMILFGLLAILTMTHSAMRIAMPCLMYSFIFPKFKL